MNDTTTSTADPTLIDTFANKVRAQPAVVMWYQNWERIGKRDFNTLTDKGTGMMDEVASRGAMPLVTWTPQDPALGTNQPEYALRAIIAGDHDEYIAHWARDARAWGKPFYLRYAHERNGKWQPWSTGVNGNTAAQYVTAWRHAHDIFRRDRRHERALAGRTLASTEESRGDLDIKTDAVQDQIVRSSSTATKIKPHVLSRSTVAVAPT